MASRASGTARTTSGTPAAEAFTAAATRARDLRTGMRRGDTAPTAADLSSLADDVTQLRVNGRWRGRTDGCAAVSAADETVLCATTSVRR